MGASRLAEAQGRCRRARSRRALPQQSGTIEVFAREEAKLCGPRHYCVVLPIQGDILGPLGASRRKSSRGDWHSFEPMVTAYLDAALSPSPETVVATRVMRWSA